jgi:hypothetical protein
MRKVSLLFALAAGLLLTTRLPAADFAVLSPATWDAYTPQGKEVDAIYGDYVLRNEHLIAVVAQPLATRNANMTVRGVGGSLIDLTERGAPNDQLSCYYPAAGRYALVNPQQVRATVDGRAAGLGADAPPVTGKQVVLEIPAEPVAGRPHLTVRYTLADGARELLVETVYSNPTDQPVADDLSDSIRADRTFQFGFDAAASCFWASDEWFRQAYGIVVPGYEVKGTGQRGTLLALVKAGGTNKLTLPPGASQTIARRIFPATSLLGVRGHASRLAGVEVVPTTIRVVDPQPVAQAQVAIYREDQLYGAGRTDPEGKVEFPLPLGKARIEVTALDGRDETIELDAGLLGQRNMTIGLSFPSYVVGQITDAAGQPIPAKVSFTGRDGTKDPDWGPDSGEIAVKNVIYTHDGTFKRAIAPGKYDVVVSYGPEHDAHFVTVEVPGDGAAEIKAQLKRSVDTAGWVSADFHSHSSPSGDNTSSQLGRVLNLLCEHVEFAPCTEHNRIDTYVPHLVRLGVQSRMATCTGIELTGSPLPINHQNAFPLVHKPRTQDGGGPVTDVDPVVQVERLALWDGGSQKLVQMNHPNLPQILGDRDQDGKPDAGFERMFGFVDVIEVHPPQGIFSPPQKGADGKLERNAIFHWLQMLNRGYRLPGVINTDSHYNYHESGFYRNFLKSSTDDPAKIDTMEMVKSAERGHVVVSTGPFLNVEARAGSAAAIPGGDLAASDGRVELSVRVQCPNWFDINRVQVFLNGRPASELNFTRRTTPQRFADGTVKFDATLPVELKRDTHLIVAAIGEGLQLGPVMGPTHSRLPPVAVSNPIFVDVDGSGFAASGDLLDLPIPLDTSRPISRPAAGAP